MKFARFNGNRTGLIVGDSHDRIVDLFASRNLLQHGGAERLQLALPQDGTGSWGSLIGQWDVLRKDCNEVIEAVGSGKAGIVQYDLAAVTLDAPLPCRERRIFSLGANTIKHIVAASAQLAKTQGRAAPLITLDDVSKPLKAGGSPVGFNVFADSVVGPAAVIEPPDFVRKLDYEGECAVVLRRHEGEEPSIWGFSAWNDFGMRDAHLGMVPVTPSFGYSLNLWKNWDTANALGPWVVVDEDYDVENLRCQLFVNGVERQDWRTSEMICSFGDTVKHLHKFMALKSGDMVTSGTGEGSALESDPASDRWLKPGDKVEVRLEGVAPLVNTISRTASAA